MEDAVQGGISLTLLADETGEGHGVGLTSQATVLVDLTNAHLHGGVVLSVDNAVSGRALSGDVEIHDLTLIVLHDY